MTGLASTGSIIAALPAHAGLRADVTAPASMQPVDAPPGGAVVGWVLVADPNSAGGARLDPVFLADGRTWTPDQYRGAYGSGLTVQVGRAQ